MKALRELAASAWPFGWPPFLLKGERRHRRRLMHVLSCWLMRVAARLLCRIDLSPLKSVPARGPLILVSNHIGSLEVPLLFAALQPRRIIGLAKIETWDSRFMGWLFTLWEAIPLRRGEADLEAFRRSLQVLEAGDLLAIAPEGTRSRHGRLLRAQPGIAVLGLRSGAPIMPIAHWGVEDFGANLKRLKRTDFQVRTGRPFRLDTNGQKVTGEIRQAMADEIMCQVAELMPKEYHGDYAAMVGQPRRYLRFL